VDQNAAMPLPPDRSAANRCLDCGADRVGPWCHECGQPVPEPLRFARIIGDAFEHLTDLGRAPGIADTVRQLTVRPGTAIGAWVDGKRASLVNPVKYAFLTLTALAVTLGVTATDAGRGIGLDSRTPAEQQALAVINALLPYLSFLSLLPVAVVQHRIFRDRRAVAENYAFQLFVSGHLALVTTVVVAAGLLESGPGLAAVALGSAGYTIFALAGYHASRGPGLLLRGTVVYVVSFIALNVLGLVLANLAHRMGVLDWLASHLA
jgi:hypothetical protein